MGVERNLMAAVLAELSGDVTLTALVPAAQITPRDSPYPAEYPAITLSAPGSRSGDFEGTWDGLFWIRMYHRGANPYSSLDAIHDRVKELLDTEDSFIRLTTVKVNVAIFREGPVSEIIVEDEAPVKETYSLNTAYRTRVKDLT